MGMNLEVVNKYGDKVKYWNVEWHDSKKETIRYVMAGYKNRKACKDGFEASMRVEFVTPLEKDNLKWENFYIHAKKQEFFKTATDVLEESE